MYVLSQNAKPSKHFNTMISYHSLTIFIIVYYIRDIIINFNCEIIISFIVYTCPINELTSLSYTT